ncbi:oligosaccharide flippase family protein [Aeromonas hydrophila]
MNIKNILSLFVGHLANFLVPFSLLFVLSRHLSESDFAFFMYAQIVMVWGGMFIEYGFTIRAVRYIKKEGRDIHDIYNLIQSTKIILSLISSVVVLVVFYIGEMSTYLNYILVCLCFIAYGLRANWYFITLELNAIMTKIDLIASMLFILVIFIPVKWELSEILFLIVLYRIFPAIIHAKIICTIDRLKFVGIEKVLQELKAGLSLFIHVLSVSFYSSFNSLYIGMFLPSSVIVNYMSAERLNNVAISIYYPIVNAFIPRIMGGDVKSRTTACLFMFTYSFLCLLGVYVTGEFFIKILLSDKYGNSIEVLRILVLSVPFVGLNYILGQFYLIPAGLEKSIAKVTVLAGGINVIILVSSVYYTGGIAFLPYLVLFIEVMISVFLFITCYCYGVFKRSSL